MRFLESGQVSLGGVTEKKESGIQNLVVDANIFIYFDCLD